MKEENTLLGSAAVALGLKKATVTGAEAQVANQTVSKASAMAVANQALDNTVGVGAGRESSMTVADSLLRMRIPILHTSGNIQDIDVSAESLIVQPEVVRTLVMTPAPLKVKITPVRTQFDQGGIVNGTSGVDAKKELFVTANASNFPFLGWAVQSEVNWLEAGGAQIELTHYVMPQSQSLDGAIEGLSTTVSVGTALQTGSVFILDHGPDIQATSRGIAEVIDTLPKEAIGMTVTPTIAESPDDFAFIGRQGGASRGLRVRGNNVVVRVYPVYLTPKLADAITMRIRNTEFSDLAALLATAYDFNV